MPRGSRAKNGAMSRAKKIRLTTALLQTVKFPKVVNPARSVALARVFMSG
jgi:hypothetical protein